jgi:DNA (cytosine-5)-methyltransferase 1
LFIGKLTDDLSYQVHFPPKEKKPAPTIKDAIDNYPPLQSGESSDIPNHEAMVHSSQMLEKMSFVKDGGSRDDIPESIRPQKGDIRKYIRYDSSKPSICITGDMRKVFHYNQNRALTVRELAAIQSYPDSFIFLGNKIKQQQMVGNSVPPLLAMAIAKAVKTMLYWLIQQSIISAIKRKLLTGFLLFSPPMRNHSLMFSQEVALLLIWRRRKGYKYLLTTY